MAIKKFVSANFYDEQVLFPAVKNAVRKQGYKLHDVYTPFPIHGLDAAMGLSDTSLTYSRIYLWYNRYYGCFLIYYLDVDNRLAFEHWR